LAERFTGVGVTLGLANSDHPQPDDTPSPNLPPTSRPAPAQRTSTAPWKVGRIANAAHADWTSLAVWCHETSSRESPGQSYLNLPWGGFLVGGGGGGGGVSGEGLVEGVAVAVI